MHKVLAAPGQLSYMPCKLIVGTNLDISLTPSKATQKNIYKYISFSSSKEYLLTINKATHIAHSTK
ncbi:MAG: hypothetical protein ACI90V_014514 [Bacillariaceae sp.]|jgi:hypothetical protein